MTRCELAMFLVLDNVAWTKDVNTEMTYFLACDKNL